MNQATLALETHPTQAGDRVGFQIGWDHARHALTPPVDNTDSALHQGWLAAKAVFGRRSLQARRSTRVWLQLRLAAWQQGLPFDDLQITPNHLGQIEASHCPVLRCALGGTQDQAAAVVRLNPDAGWAAGNLAALSREAAAQLQDLQLASAIRQARIAEAAGDNTAAAWRLITLRSFTTALPFAQAARLPLAVLPPNRVRLVNPVQALQALVTRQFTASGWAQRCRQLAASLPEHSLRHDFNLFVGAMAPRVLEAGTEGAAVRAALEDAWLQERVQRRWQHLVLSLGEAGCATLLERAAELPLPGVRVMQHRAGPPIRLAHVRRARQPASVVAPRPGRPGTAAAPAAPATHA
jgi:hypothetical protein